MPGGGGSLQLNRNAHSRFLCGTVVAATREGACAMKNFASASFFRTFDMLASAGNPGNDTCRWVFKGVNWDRERYSFAGPDYSLALEVFILECPGRDGWRLIVIREFWWVGPRKDPLKTLRWARPLGGAAKSAIAWFRQEQAALERGPTPIGPLSTS
jgi:hypothetical protein